MYQHLFGSGSCGVWRLLFNMFCCWCTSNPYQYRSHRFHLHPARRHGANHPSPGARPLTSQQRGTQTCYCDASQYSNPLASAQAAPRSTGRTQIWGAACSHFSIHAGSACLVALGQQGHGPLIEADPFLLGPLRQVTVERSGHPEIEFPAVGFGAPATAR